MKTKILLVLALIIGKQCYDSENFGAAKISVETGKTIYWNR